MSDTNTALERLELAVTRLTLAAQKGRKDTIRARADQAQLESVSNNVAQRLDDTIARLRGALGE